MTHNVETMAYAAATGAPWHRIGTALPETCLDADSMTEAAGMGWDVSMEPLFADTLLGRIAIPTYRAVVRSDNRRVLGVVGEGYTPLQNREVFSFLDGLLQDGRIQYETAGVLRLGALVWALARIPGEVMIAGDVHKSYMLMAAGHDGGHAVSIQPTDVTVVCNNTLNMALSQDKKAATTFRFLHTSSLKDRLAQASSALQMTTEAQARMAAMMEKMAATRVERADFLRLEEELFGPADERGPRVTSKVGQFRSIVREDVMRRGQNAYALLQGVTGFVTHARGAALTSPERREKRFESVLMGSGADLTAKGFRLLAELAK